MKIDEFEQFPALASGDLDATLEVWPSVHPKDYKNYIEADAGVVDAGPLGVVGQIGWFIPTYMVDGTRNSRRGRDSRATSRCSRRPRRARQGQLVDADPAFGSYDQQIADNLGLNFKVVYAGSEAAELTALDAAYSKQDPFLFYFWTPHWAQAKYDLTHGRAARDHAGVRGRGRERRVEVRVRLPAGPAVQGVQRGPADRRRPRHSRSCRR